MYDLSKRYREAMKSKAHRLAGAPDRKVDSSDWSPAPLLRADMKTGARPVSGPSKKGIGESNAARDVKSALGTAHRGAFKSGGGVKDKKALGAIDPTPKRGAAGHYKRGGDASYVGAESVTKDDKPVTRPSDINSRQQREPEPSDLYSPDQMKRLEQGRKSGGAKWIQSAIKKPGALRKSLDVKEGETIPADKLAKAAEKGGKLGQRARLAQTLKGLGRPGRKAGGAAPNLTVIVADKGRGDMMSAQGRGGVMPVPMTPPAGAPLMPPPAGMAPPVAAPPPAGMPPMARKSGGRITKVASSYKDMEAGAATGEGRLQKTDIAEKRKSAPTRRTGGRAVA